MFNSKWKNILSCTLPLGVYLSVSKYHLPDFTYTFMNKIKNKTYTEEEFTKLAQEISSTT